LAQARPSPCGRTPRFYNVLRVAPDFGDWRRLPQRHQPPGRHQRGSHRGVPIPSRLPQALARFFRRFLAVRFGAPRPAALIASPNTRCPGRSARRPEGTRSSRRTISRLLTGALRVMTTGCPRLMPTPHRVPACRSTSGRSRRLGRHQSTADANRPASRISAKMAGPSRRRPHVASNMDTT